ncbi:hypothetical protein [Candidatus Vampirococcus lugosii]|uniref:Uncharacterized protein n=1 Tax=Candidatus Vampirococcus lugosii TaxID=2789015 RepID=A0ABS5QMU6_9BACT|nr:hypothetical protein [Candidatus Vampirococcus lugosii]MBS8122384.1 hypothetical protein [Candidatus Vampirococcus lugosii]
MIINKERYGDINIGKLIILSISIILAVWLIGILLYFNIKYQKTVVLYSALGNIDTASQILIDLDICDEDSKNIKITYNAISSKYTLDCDLIEGTIQDYKIQELTDLNTINATTGKAIYSIPDK